MRCCQQQCNPHILTTAVLCSSDIMINWLCAPTTYSQHNPRYIYFTVREEIAARASCCGHLFFVGEFSYIGKNLAICGRWAGLENFIIGVVGIGTEVTTLGSYGCYTRSTRGYFSVSPVREANGHRGIFRCPMRMGIGVEGLSGWARLDWQCARARGRHGEAMGCSSCSRQGITKNTLLAW